MSFQEIPPFFEPGAPPLILSIPLAQTEIGKMQASDKLLAQEELPSSSCSTRERSKVRFNPFPSQSIKRTKKHVSAESDSDSLSDLSSLTESDSEDEEDEELISKPEGEAGRPGRGGYNLENALGWPGKEYRQLKRYIKKLVNDHLVIEKNFSSQSLASIVTVQSLASEKFPGLRRYAGCWPVTDLVRLELKYTSVRSRLVQKNDTKAKKPLTRTSGK